MIHVCSLDAVAAVAERVAPGYLISLVDPGRRVDRPPPIAPANHLTWHFHDIVEARPGHVAPAAGDIERLLRFGRAWDAAAPLLIHCHGGVSRSPAAAFILICQLNQGRERDAALLLRKRARHAWPNHRMVELADGLMKRGGRMMKALLAMTPPETNVAARLISLPVRLAHPEPCGPSVGKG